MPRNRNLYYFFRRERELVEQIVSAREDGAPTHHTVDIADGEACFMQNRGDGAIWGQDSTSEVLFVKAFRFFPTI